MNEKVIELVVELLKGEKKKAAPFQIGEKVLIRTVTYFVSGEIVELVGDWVVLKDAAWVAHSGRFHQAVPSGDFEEVEPVDGPVRVNLGAAVDVYVLSKLPREVK